MAEVASGVLHNIGNILNSVNVSAYRIRQTALQSKLDRIVFDRHMVLQILFNLLRNAVDSMKSKPNPGGTLNMTLEKGK